uniref:Reelin domain-containing protein n=1 Tax=Cynoglossus semilaevis TaxID=244447 RepID=A0A3P8X213_CYNSE
MSPSLCVPLLTVVCAFSVELCLCFPNGSVAFSCGNMMPEHPPFTPSTSSPPFRLSTSSTTYKPGKVITVYEHRHLQVYCSAL